MWIFQKSNWIFQTVVPLDTLCITQIILSQHEHRYLLPTLGYLWIKNYDKIYQKFRWVAKDNLRWRMQLFRFKRQLADKRLLIVSRWPCSLTFGACHVFGFIQTTSLYRNLCIYTCLNTPKTSLRSCSGRIVILFICRGGMSLVLQELQNLDNVTENIHFLVVAAFLSILSLRELPITFPQKYRDAFSDGKTSNSFFHLPSSVLFLAMRASSISELGSFISDDDDEDELCSWSCWLDWFAWDKSSPAFPMLADGAIWWCVGYGCIIDRLDVRCKWDAWVIPLLRDDDTQTDIKTSITSH